jgi:hypothetical protein
MGDDIKEEFQALQVKWSTIKRTLKNKTRKDKKLKFYEVMLQCVPNIISQ